MLAFISCSIPNGITFVTVKRVFKGKNIFPHEKVLYFLQKKCSTSTKKTSVLTKQNFSIKEKASWPRKKTIKKHVHHEKNLLPWKKACYNYLSCFFLSTLLCGVNLLFFFRADNGELADLRLDDFFNSLSWCSKQWRHLKAEKLALVHMLSK